MWLNCKVSKTKVGFIGLSYLAVLKAQLHNRLDAGRNVQCFGCFEEDLETRIYVAIHRPSATNDSFLFFLFFILLTY
jgi:hypothetical protein